MADNIIKLATLQDAGELPASSEDVLALTYADRHAADSRYVAAWGRWLLYDGARWSFDNTLHAFDRARAICRESARECAKPTAVVSAKTVAAVVWLARADRRLAATDEQFDENHMLLVTAADEDTPAATYDLTTGLSRPPEPLDYMTKATACSAAARGTPHPRWSAFLDRITGGDVELQAFLRRYIGYCCTGLTSEHAFLFAYGTGANGKSTFINTITRILAEYVAVADMGTFIASNTERHPTDLAKLRGARLVVAQETQKGRRWDETKIKALTGGDRLTARFMRQDFFDFVPTFKLFIAGNHKPRLGSVDEAMRRRLLIVPFTVRIPADERDPELAEKLWGERAAILRWCLDGCLQWQRDGLAAPACVRDATDEYFRDQDTTGEWLEDCTEDADDRAFTRMADLFASWKIWCEDRNIMPGSSKALSGMLEDRGYAKRREAGTGQRGFARIVVKKH
ncbi:phage/plasmid primase, P4 family [Bradyrhizobium sp. McL0616]|uniref:phage/plasmid primase, P4 family n=1 Tax=Bradyrhizobium sp. McL0616 TaxID=3415674 RepID=UPI003CE793BC